MLQKKKVASPGRCRLRRGAAVVLLAAQMQTWRRAECVLWQGKLPPGRGAGIRGGRGGRTAEPGAPTTSRRIPARPRQPLSHRIMARPAAARAPISEPLITRARDRLYSMAKRLRGWPALVQSRAERRTPRPRTAGALLPLYRTILVPHCTPPPARPVTSVPARISSWPPAPLMFPSLGDRHGHHHHRCCRLPATARLASRYSPRHH